MIIGFYPKLQCSESSKKSATKHQLGPTQLKFQMSTFLQNFWHFWGICQDLFHDIAQNMLELN